MNAPCSGSIIEVKSQASHLELQNETRPPHDMKPATHPFGSVLLRLELALAMILRRTNARLQTGNLTKHL